MLDLTAQLSLFAGGVVTDRAAHDHRPPRLPAPSVEQDPLLRDLIGQALRRVRTEQGKTLREVAEAAQVSVPYLSEIERGRKEPSSEVLAAVNRALGMGLDELLGTLTADLRPAAPVTMLRPAAPQSPGGSQAMLLAA